MQAPVLARDKRIFNLWLACSTQEEIAEAVGISQAEVAKTTLFQTENLPNGIKPTANHLTDFTPPLAASTRAGV